MKWEYLVKLPDNNFVDQNELDYLGDKGWELVSVDNGIAYFKRPDFSDIADKAIKMIALASSEEHVNFEGIQSQVKTGYIDAR